MCYGKPSILIPTPNHTEQLNNAGKAVELGVASIVDQDSLSKETLLSRIDEIVKSERFLERVRGVQEEVSTLDGLEIAIETTIKVAQGGKHDVPT
jgi:UDP:flavonoid glycosyltransferase YjiC (YdhE family)